MSEQKFLFDRQTWGRFVSSLKLFAFSQRKHEGAKALWLFIGLMAFMLGINGLNVVNSYVGRDFMTSIENRNLPEFIKQALLYIGVFAGTTIVAVFFRYTEETLGVLWREWATRRCIVGYASHRVYYRLKQKGEVGNPDQRIADDIRTYTASTLSFMIMLLNGTFTVIAFSGVLWSISPLLFGVSVAYAAIGTCLTFFLGRPLIRLNYDQLDKEADFRAVLTYLRSNAESVAISRREGGLIQLSLNKLAELLSNFRRIITINRNVNFFTTGYNWMIQIIPALIVAPLFIEGKVELPSPPWPSAS
jgi:vitamin B12/bleomycin/antimicrobial peptide transport system ATP-binding/permease protein